MMEPKNLCAVCGGIAACAFSPCEECEKRMRWYNTDACSVCAADLAGADNPCPDCREREEAWALDGLSCIGPWMGPLREWLSMLKYGGDARLALWLARELIEIRAKRWPDRPVIPVPPRRGKIRREGHYTVYQLADVLAGDGIPVLKALTRLDKMTQKSLNREERLKGCRLSYRINARVNLPPSVILLDDVTTTGATLSKCATILKSAGVKQVFAMAVCRD
ncbi:MAG: hypothetical protein B0D92_02450 [Spirochaeta sp. LUC14_002_19_P3]|nr:MAG: hypothetical protein B0D92_02450 [Spirochaeta sp. LUC14_002_19_P3]